MVAAGVRTGRTGPPVAWLCCEVDAIEQALPRLATPELSRRIDMLRREARADGLIAAGMVAAALGDALARAGRGAMVRTYLCAIREAAGCPTDAGPREAATILASIGVRLAG